MTRHWFILVFLALMPLAQAAQIDKSDLNGDGIVDDQDLDIVATDYLEQDPSTVDWCVFRESSILNPKYFRRIMSDSINHYQALLDYINVAYGCDDVNPGGDLSDLNEDGTVDLDDLVIFSTNYLQKNWETVDWCVFHGAVLAGADYDGQPTSYYLENFVDLLAFINVYFNCGGEPPPSDNFALENTPRLLARIATGASGDTYITDPRVGSLFIYDEFMVLTGELKGLNKPLGVAIDLQGNILVGNNGRDNVEVYSAITGELLAVVGQGVLKMPTAITVDATGDIYVTDSQSHVVHVFDSTYNPVRVIGRPGVGRDTLTFPTDTEIMVSTGGGTANQKEIFVADQGNSRVQVFDETGNWLRSLTFDGIEGQNCSWFTGECEIPGTPAFTRVQALSKDSQGQLHVLDNFAAAAIVLDPADSTYLSHYGGYGTGSGLLRVPMDVLVTPTGNAIVTTGDADRIEIFTAQ